MQKFFLYGFCNQRNITTHKKPARGLSLLYTGVMKTVEDASYGVVPVRKNEAGEWEFFLINQQSSLKGTNYWIFPKGHPEGEETPEETARRELLEETSLVVTTLHEKTFSLYYDFMHEETLIRKTVTFFIGLVGDGTARVDGVEVITGDWFVYDKARNQLTYNDSKDLLRAIKEELQLLSESK